MRHHRNKIYFFLLFSLLLHSLLIFLLMMGAPLLKKSDRTAKKDKIEVFLAKNSYQIADIAPPEKEEKPKESKFAGLYDSRVEEEQVAGSREASSGKSRSRSMTPPQPGQKARNGDGEYRGEMVQGESDEMLEALPEDFYPDYKVGDRTYLNVLRFPKIGYFVRLKKTFKTTFNPNSAIRSYLFSNQISKGQVEVVLGAAVGRSGTLDELFVINSSGLPLYDQEAIRTIRDSSPFAAPPAELLDAASKLRMVWTFTVYL